MDRKLIIAGVVALLLVGGGVGFFVMNQTSPATADTTPAVPATQLQNELPTDVKTGSDSSTHSTE